MLPQRYGVRSPGGPGAPDTGTSASAAIINPTREAWDEPVTARVILTFTLPDYRYLCRLVQPAGPVRYVYNCALREGSWDGRPITLTAPALGAPYAVMVLEKLMVLGARMVLALGWCGSLQSGLSIGDLVLPTTTVSTEGTSGHYPLDGQPPDPDPGLSGVLRRLLSTSDHRWQEGTVWSTDGFYRETVQQVAAYQSQGVLGVDMEMAALFTVGRFRQTPVAGLLVVSDELSTLQMEPGLPLGAFSPGPGSGRPPGFGRGSRMGWRPCLRGRSWPWTWAAAPRISLSGSRARPWKTASSWSCRRPPRSWPGG